MGSRLENRHTVPWILTTDAVGVPMNFGANVKYPDATPGGFTEGSPPDAQTRIIVEFPWAAVPPRECTARRRDAPKGFEVPGIRRGTDGQVNV
jgi:hypothetical protein